MMKQKEKSPTVSLKWFGFLMIWTLLGLWRDRAALSLTRKSHVAF